MSDPIVIAEGNLRRRERRLLLSPKKPLRTDGQKECRLCRCVKPVTEFYARKKESRDHLFNWCRACCIRRSTEYKARRRAEVTQIAR